MTCFRNWQFTALVPLVVGLWACDGGGNGTSGTGGTPAGGAGGGGASSQDAGPGGAVVPDVGHGGVVVPDAAAGGVIVPDAATGGAIVPDAAAGGVIVPDAATGGVIVPDAATGGVLVPDAGAGGVLVPDAAAGGAIVPDAAAGGAIVPDAATGGVLVPDAALPPTCEPACGPCQICDTTGAAPVCIDTCGDDELCMGGACRPVGMHAGLDTLVGPFADGPAVTTQCLTCHPNEGQDFLQTAHWNWAGPTPGMVGHEDDTHVGKRNLINNFCIATDSNEARCTQCHAGYGWRDDTFNFQDATRIDCLVCHADSASGYTKDPRAAGAPAAAVDLVLAARSVGRPTRDNCGACHFYAGGADNVKKGDLGSALKTATPEADVHMGNGMECADCHATEQHQVLGQGAHIGVSAGRFDCTQCHGEGPHADALTNNHAQDLACQTCHVPAFSRQQPTKMFWDWSTAGNRTRGQEGVERATLPDGTPYTAYDYMKGDFVWEKNVRPTYAWYDGRVQRMTTEDTFPDGAGAPDAPIVMGRPVATQVDAEAKIWPFKVMRGRQAVDPVRHLVIVPKLFGPGGFWGAIPAADAYTPEAVRALWTSSLTAGARTAGQIGPDEAYTDDTWTWGETTLWMGIEHEVAPPAMALDCAACHGNPDFDFLGLGYACDPMVGGPGCGSRH